MDNKSNRDFLGHSGGLGDRQFNNRMEREQHKGSSGIIYGTDGHYLNHLIQRVSKMAETKIAAILLNLIGIPLCFISFLSNLDNIKSAVLFLCALCFILIRMYFFVIWAKQKTRKQEYELRQLERDDKKAQ